mmetsp:Transcript_22334/g.33509  ORF Transcript_22334/g.33509 Transcript_22334/m.33509 type:complete len:224 (-) Transcript_22334:176-847(-)
MEELLRMEKEAKGTKGKQKREKKKLDLSDPMTMNGYVNYGAVSRRQANETRKSDVAQQPFYIDAVPGEIPVQKEKDGATVLDAETISLQSDQYSVADKDVAASYAEFEVISGSSSDNAYAAEVEILNDDEAGQFIEVKYATAEGDELKTEDEGVEAEPPLFIKILLRSIDVVFYLAEKTIIGIPRAVTVGSTFLSRVDKAQQKGSVSEGWKLLDNLRNAENRY